MTDTLDPALEAALDPKALKAALKEGYALGVHDRRVALIIAAYLAAASPQAEIDRLREALDKADKLIGFWSDYRSLPSDEFLAKYTLDRETSSLRMTELALQYRESRAAISAIERHPMTVADPAKYAQEQARLWHAKGRECDAFGRYIEGGRWEHMARGADEIAKALAASQQQGPEIKGLEWFKWDKRDAGSSAETIIGRYHVWTHHEAEGKWFYRLTMTGLGPTVINGECVDETEGKQKCQDHFDATIRTALAPSVGAEEPSDYSSDVTAEGVQAMRDKAAGQLAGDDYTAMIYPSSRAPSPHKGEPVVWWAHGLMERRPDRQQDLFVSEAEAKRFVDSQFDMRLRKITPLYPQAPIPEGMVLVPREPTQEMLDAVTAADQREPFSDATMGDIYRAMLAAATPAPQAEPGAGE